MIVCPLCRKYICECGDGAMDRESVYVSYGCKSEPLDRDWFISFEGSAEDIKEEELWL